VQILIIGATGMVGRELTNHLAAKGHLGDRTISRLTLHDVIDPGIVTKVSFTVNTFASDRRPRPTNG
jgi:D-erythronate 2-dehydrogenase